MPAHSSSLYVLFHVPYGTQAGIYTGTLHVSNGAEQVDLAVRLQVWSFGWQRLSVHTGFIVNFKTVGSDALATYAMLEQHGVTPLMPKAAPHVQANGDIAAAAYANELRPYLEQTASTCRSRVCRGWLVSRFLVEVQAGQRRPW